MQALQNGLRAIGVRGNYSGHSFRRGEATTAKDLGLLEEDIGNRTRISYTSKHTRTS